MIRTELRIDTLVELAVSGASHVESLVPPVARGQFLLDNIRSQGNSEMIRLSREIRTSVVILTVLLELVVPKIAPEDGAHAKLVRQSKGLRNLLDLPGAFGRSEVDGGSHRHGPHVVSLFHLGKENLIIAVGIRQQFIVVDFENEGDFMSILTGHRGKHPQSGGHTVASSFHGKLHDFFGVEILRIGSEGSSSGVFHSLIHRQNGKISRSSEPTVIKEPRKTLKHPDRSIRGEQNAVHPIRPREMYILLGYRSTHMIQQGFCLISQ